VHAPGQGRGRFVRCSFPLNLSRCVLASLIFPEQGSASTAAGRVENTSGEFSQTFPLSPTRTQRTVIYKKKCFWPQVGLPFLSFMVIGWLGLQEGLKAKFKESERRKRYIEPEKPEDILKVHDHLITHTHTLTHAHTHIHTNSICLSLTESMLPPRIPPTAPRLSFCCTFSRSRALSFISLSLSISPSLSHTLTHANTPNRPTPK